jgi:hypothetical protein
MNVEILEYFSYQLIKMIKLFNFFLVGRDRKFRKSANSRKSINFVVIKSDDLAKSTM